MIGGFRKNTKRGNFRKKVVVSEDEEEQEQEQENKDLSTPVVPTPAPEPSPAIINNIKAKTKSKTSLSFGEELEKEDQFVLKRSKASLSLNEQVKREKKIKKQKASLIVVQENNSGAVASCNIPAEIKTEASNEPILAQTQVPFNNKNGHYHNTILNNYELDEKYGDLPMMKSEVDYQSTTTTTTTAEHHFSMKKNRNPGAIPDAATIYAMKKKREQARNFSGQADYIPLSMEGNKKNESSITKAGSSRLIREDDSSDDERVEMKGTVNKSHPALERRKQVALALSEMADEEGNTYTKEDEDEEILAWEDEQMKKGSKIPTNQPDKKYGPQLPDQKKAHPFAPPLMGVNNFIPSHGMPPAGFNFLPATAMCGVPPPMCGVPPPEPQVVSVDMVEQRLREQLETKRQLHRMHKQQVEKTKFDLELSQENIGKLETKANDASDRFTLYQDIRGYIKDLFECLGEKVKRINELEDSMHQLLKKRTAKLVTRRLNDVKDQVDEIGGKNVNDSGRIANIKNRRIAEREARRERRRDYRRKTPNMPHNEGMSSDDEMIPNDIVRFDSERAIIMQDSEKIFSEVVEDFTSVKAVMKRFEVWKFAFNESYKQAYLALCLPKLFTPYIKLELLNWNPLEVETKELEDYNWYRSLLFYGFIEGEFDLNDEDLKLLPNVIEKALIPKLTVLLRDVWDPLSSKQTKVITFLLQRLIDDYPSITKESKTTKDLIDTVITRLSSAVESEIYIPLYSRDQLEVRNSPALMFLERQFWTGVKLLQNLMEWNWLLSQKKLLELGVDAILNRYLIIALQQFLEPMLTLEKAKTIINLLPKEWFEKSDGIVVGMDSIARFLSGLAGTVYKASLGYTDSLEQKKMKITIKKIISLLMHIQAFDEARNVATNYSTKRETDSPVPT